MMDCCARFGSFHEEYYKEKQEMTLKQLLFAAGSILTALSGAFAQAPEPPTGGDFTVAIPAGEPGNRVMMYHTAGVAGVKQNLGFVSSGFSFDGAVVKNAPYSAEAVTETMQRLADGNRISRKTTSVVYRDSEGRTRREETLGSIGPWATNSEPLQTVFINDPVSKMNLVLDARTKTAQRMPNPEIMPLPPGVPGGPIAITGSMAQPDVVRKRVAVRTYSTQAQMGGAIGGVFTAAVSSAGVPADGENMKTESLGKQLIEGVQADGTRTTVTIPAGAVGNERPIEIVSERWYSPDLQTVVKSTHNDPRMEETVYRLINISRNEPPQSLFVAPADYAVTDNEVRMKMIDEQKAILERGTTRSRE
jgi:hypothetical protein